MDMVSGLFKVLYWPICRVYAREILRDKPADAIFRFLCSLQFLRVHRYWPNFMHPRRFSEKVWSCMLHERDPQFTLISDKLRARDYVTSKVGSKYLIPLFWSGDKPEEIPFDQLPSKFVIKTNHGCGYNIIVKDKTLLDRTGTRMQLKKWLCENFCQDKYLGTEWGYKNIKQTIMVESFLEDNGQAPADYKFWCFSGRAEIITIHFDRFVGHTFRAFDRNFEPSEFGFGPALPLYTGEYQQPPNFDKMLQVAESLAEGFDFIRVDLYNLENNIYFGELTPYPGGGTARFLPVSQDCILGERWKSK